MVEEEEEERKKEAGGGGLELTQGIELKDNGGVILGWLVCFVSLVVFNSFFQISLFLSISLKLTYHF